MSQICRIGSLDLGAGRMVEALDGPWVEFWTLFIWLDMSCTKARYEGVCRDKTQPRHLITSLSQRELHKGGLPRNEIIRKP